LLESDTPKDLPPVRKPLPVVKGWRDYPSTATPAATAQTAEKAAPGAINYMANNDRFLLNAANRADIDPPGYLDVVAHGDPNGIVINGTLTTAKDAAQLIAANPQFAGQNIRLLSCSTGASPTGFAQQLANELNVTVRAPTDTLWAYGNGSLTIGPTPVANSGSWVNFIPTGAVP
jgi:filamentous hemagglutinin